MSASPEGSILSIDPADLHPGEGADRPREAAARYTLHPATTWADFDEAWGTLHSYFGPTGEIEREETLRAWFARGSLSEAGAPIRVTYHAVLARDRDGSLAGVRDCFVTVDAAARRAVVLLSHNLVLPDHRRSGLAALLRTVPVTLAREALAQAGAGPGDGGGEGSHGGEILLVAEMEMVEAKDRASVVRLMSYARAGYRVVPPWILPYAQPDFRDLDALGEAPKPLPFLALVRHASRLDPWEMPRAHAQAVVEHLFAIHRCHCKLEHLLPLRENALRHLEAFPGESIPLLRPPASPAEVGGLWPLLRVRTLPYYPPAWWWGAPDLDPAQELVDLLTAWNPPEGAGALSIERLSEAIHRIAEDPLQEGSPVSLAYAEAYFSGLASDPDLPLEGVKREGGAVALHLATPEARDRLIGEAGGRGIALGPRGDHDAVFTPPGLHPPHRLAEALAAVTSALGA